MRAAFALLSLMCTVPGYAQSIAPDDTDPRKEACPAVARQAGFAYTSKHENGKPFILTRQLRSGILLPIYTWSIDYAQNKANGIDDAVHRAIEKCMANVELVERNARNGIKTQVDDLQ